VVILAAELSREVGQLQGEEGEIPVLDLEAQLQLGAGEEEILTLDLEIQLQLEEEVHKLLAAAILQTRGPQAQGSHLLYQFQILV
jgi:hypothetical protein